MSYERINEAGAYTLSGCMIKWSTPRAETYEQYVRDHVIRDEVARFVGGIVLSVMGGSKTLSASEYVKLESALNERNPEPAATREEWDKADRARREHAEKREAQALASAKALLEKNATAVGDAG